MKPVYILEARRSAIGRFGGALRNHSPSSLATAVAEAMLPVGIRELVEEVILGQVVQAGSGMNVARQVALQLGLPNWVPAYTVNMACGSSLKAVSLAAQSIASDEYELVLAGGVEVMSLAPFYSSDLRWGRKLGDAALQDALMVDGLTDPSLGIGMGETAENIAAHLGISRAEQDAFAAESQQRAARYQSSFGAELVPISIAGGKEVFATDEHPRPETTLEGLAKLKPIVRSSGSVTAGNASGINDGAAMVLLGCQEAGETLGLKPRAQIVATVSVGCDPAMMGLGPVAAIGAVLARADWEQSSVDAFEINEAFAVQTLGCIRQLDLPPERVNARGGAIALGHPIGASGARVLVSLLHHMESQNLRRGIASLCIGGGMGIAMAIERG
jgi:acetyl-CoA C-acetyltransferase